MKRENLLFIFLLLVVLLIVFYPSAGWKFRDFLAPAGGQNGDYKNLLLENEALKTELAKLKSPNGKKAASESMAQFSVYSNYPLNFKNELLVDGGEKEGVKTGQPVFISPASSSRVLIGRVEKVFEKNSLVRTVFDSNFQLSVRIGAAGVSSLLKGGNSPRLTLIPKDAQIAAGDAVYSTAPDYPFGLAVGLAKNIRLSSDQFFEEADLETAYNPNDFQTVFIDTAYNGRR